MPNAPQCHGAGEVYVNHSEVEGRYDECLSPAPGREAPQDRQAAAASRSTRLPLDRNRFNCSYRGGWVMQGGVCVVREGPPPAADLGGFFMIGDSVSWRADDELAAREPAGSSTCAPAAGSTSCPAGWTGSAPTTATPTR